ncbi:helix-turn-helix domain-containing protein [Breznakia pachnodae]|uniref:AraC-like DNA-binding protein n=1 Tax=Breznakia pachnodae TaxID=265178 RepID=A0ABU0E4E5_9FIRM|nr:helix-turn-helix domain-containing protein [Breznakia pachnodae]MDQ0361691.1 AraC-like DNA-binding protein [Breznakia pachnodae]
MKYKEYIPKQYQEHIMCIWVMKSKSYLEVPVNNIILPDACIDLVIDFNRKEIVFSAMSKATTNMSLTGDIDFMGIRFRTGVFHNIYNINSVDVMDKRIPYQEIEKHISLSDIFSKKSEDERKHFLLNYLSEITQASQVDMFIREINSLKNMETIKYSHELAKRLGYSDRQMNRVFLKRCGFTIKTYLNIVRLHKALHLLIYSNNQQLISLVEESGFYDQSHFCKEIDRYIGVSPTKLIENYRKMS